MTTGAVQPGWRRGMLPGYTRPYRVDRSDSPSLLSDAWTELRRRKVVRAGGAYAVAAFVVLQLAEITFDPLGLPPRALTWTILAVILGFPLVLVFSWYFDLGPRGVTRDRSPAARAGAVFAVLLVLLTTGGFGLWLVGIYERSSGPAAAASTAPVNTVAVLPFDDMSAERDQSYLAEGIAEELLDRLAQDGTLQVAARTSSFALRAQGLDARQIGETLGVRWLLEGSVRKAGERLRITAQLIDAGSGFHHWSRSYERDDGDLFALQDEVSSAIAETLRGLLGKQARAAVADEREQSSDPAALEAFLAGRQQWRLRTATSLDAALAHFRQAVELDAEFARAWSGLADTYLLQASYDLRPVPEALALAEPAAVRAVTLAPDLGEAWASIGLLRSIAGQREAAERSLREAMRLDPRYEMAAMWLADVLGSQGDYPAEQAVLEQAHALNPLEPVIGSNLAQSMALRGHPDAAEDLLQRLLAVSPDSGVLLRGAAHLAEQRGDLARALTLADRAEQVDPRAPANLELRLRLLLLLGAAEEASSLVERSLPDDIDAGIAARQWIALYADAPRRLPALDALLPQRQHATGDEARLLIMLGGWTAILAGRDQEARQLFATLHEMPGMAHLQQIEIASILAALTPATERVDTDWCEAGRHWRGFSANTQRTLFLAAGALALCGDQTAALDSLASAIDQGFRDWRQLAADPRFAALREQPRLIAAQREIQQRVEAERRAAGL